jgi:hypothetical protein
MVKVEHLEKLVEEAFGSYRIYLELSGVLTDSGAKLALLKWPDIAQIAIAHIQDPSDDKLDLLYADLCIAIIAPLEKIYDSTVERLEQLTGQKPAGIEEVGHLILKKSVVNPIDLKFRIISELNKMFVALHTLTGIEYPPLKERDV